jgi:hypothetical protein
VPLFQVSTSLQAREPVRSFSEMNSTDTLELEPMFIPVLNGNIIFDGIVNDSCWDNLTPLPVVMHIPTFGNQPTEKSDIYICHDNTYVYLAGRFFDKEASKINVSSLMRDDIPPQDDAFWVIFDTFNDHENALGFMTNAAGIRQDLTISADGSENNPFNSTWNTFWDVKSTKDDKGWYTEMRIPLSSLRFKEANGKVQMGFICFRFIPRKFEISIFPAVERKWGFWSFLKPSQGREIQMEGVHSKKPFYVAPYVTTGFSQESVLTTAGTDYKMKNDPKLAGGLDIKYGLTSNLTADLTLNTDFAQVESDNAQINLTRFSLFFPEKRMFFQERSSNFAYTFDDRNTLFYSRRIGLHEGRAVPIIGGARLVGRAGPWDIGFLDMQTQAYKTNEADGTNLPSENFGLLRMRRQVFNKSSYVGGVLTSRMGRDGTYNEVMGIDGIFNLFGDDFMDIKYAQSFDEKYHNNIASTDASRIYLDWQRRREKGLGYDFFYTRAGEKYKPDLGFEFRENYYMFGTQLKFGWFPGESSKISKHVFSLNSKTWNDIGTNTTQSSLNMASYNLQFKSSWGILLMFHQVYENLSDTFSLSDDAVKAYIPTGKYNYRYGMIDINTPYTNPFTVEVMSNFGQYYDGNQVTFQINSNYKIGAFLSLGPSYEFDKIRLPSREQSFSGHIAGLNALLMFNNKLSINSLVQYSNIEHGIFTNLRLRYNPGEGNDLYLVINEGRNIEILREYPALDPVGNRGILLKYTYTFIL